ncbi:DUF302 domain-containing protein [Nocardia brevicatena]|uniref:DUF302 domain-containing protein n=1 Tax=Nocardia brevicatena TaxID=37327 RepID=UPI0002F303BE|nr:DUF302 domain-containing protein [Nocardia brevicatena]
MKLALSTTVHTTFDEAVARTRQALSEQGFGVLTEIDVKATLKTKIDEDVEDYLILGACNPSLAYHAVNVNRQIGLLLPCNVVVRRDVSAENAVLVEAMNPELMVEVTDEPGLREVAAQAVDKLQAAIDTLDVGRDRPESASEG